MTDQEFYAPKNMDLFTPDGVEFIYTILDGTQTFPRNTSEARKYGLQILEKLLEKELIEVFRWSNKENDFSKEGILKYVESVWFVGADFIDFLSMPMFKYKDWYINALEDKGLTSTTFFRTFVKEELGDIGDFIEKNRPKML